MQAGCPRQLRAGYMLCDMEWQLPPCIARGYNTKLIEVAHTHNT